MKGNPDTIAAALDGWTPSSEVVAGISSLMKAHRESLVAERLLAQRSTMSRASGATAA